jgi:hypothetical protein
MQRFLGQVLSCLLLGALAGVAGCKDSKPLPPPPPPNPSYSVQLITSLMQSAPAAQVAAVKVTLSSTGVEPRSLSLTQSGTRWEASIEQLPVGTEHTLVAEAFNASGQVLLTAQARSLGSVDGQTVLVALALHPRDDHPSSGPATPRLTSVIATPSSVLPGQALSLQSFAEDPNPGDSLTYAWTASAGVLTSRAWWHWPRATCTPWQ